MAESFRTLRHRLADQIEPRSWGLCTTTSAGAADTVISTALAISRGDQNALDTGWVYWTAGALLGQNRPIRRSGLDISTGTITLATAFSATTPTTTEFELHTRYPVKRDSGSPLTAGYLEMINDALQRLWFQDDIALTTVANQTRYLLDIATYPWLAEPERILDVIDPVGSDNVKRPTNQQWYIDDDAETPALICPAGFAGGQTAYLRCARPAWTRIKIGGTWTDLTPSSLNNGKMGLAADSDETHARLRDVLALAITESMNHLGLTQPAFAADEWEQRRKYWATVAAQCKHRRLPRRRQPRQRAIYVGGGLMGGWA